MLTALERKFLAGSIVSHKNRISRIVFVVGNKLRKAKIKRYLFGLKDLN